MKRIGACFIGALGSISLTAIIGARAIQESLANTLGMVTESELFCDLDLAPLGDIQFCGFDIRQGKLSEIVKELQTNDDIFGPELLRIIQPFLGDVDDFILPGISLNCGQAICKLSSPQHNDPISLRETIELIKSRLNHFRKSLELDDLVVVNLASTEPLMELKECHQNVSLLEQSIDQNLCENFIASSLYAYAAITSHCPYINFTPSNGALFPAMIKLAQKNGIPVMGNDGKTGETLVKSVLAPMFKCRNLEVMSWEGFNILGNMDGQVLDHAENRKSKIKTKDSILPKILGYSPHSKVHINYVPSLGDQKTAWDFIHFKGFLGARMSLQFTWQGFDSALAAPLILDLVRLAELAHRRGESGLMIHLASYFKDPLGVPEQSFAHQFDMLEKYVSNYKIASNAERDLN